MKMLLGLSIVMALTSPLLAGGGGTTTTTGAFNFTGNVGTVLTYHAYGFVCQVGSMKQPSGTLRLGNWYVKDLGPVSGTKTISCPKPTVPKGTTSSVLGVLFYASSKDIGGQPFTHPVVDVQIYDSRWYNGNASIQVIEPDGSGLSLYFAAPFSPFAWDLRPYIWDSPPL